MHMSAIDAANLTVLSNQRLQGIDFRPFLKLKRIGRDIHLKWRMMQK